MSANNTNGTCAGNGVPEPINLGIDSKSTVAVVHRGNYMTDTPDDWMVTCCAPNAVQLASDGFTGTCWEWCDLPSQYTNGTGSEPSVDFLNCITTTARFTNSSYPPSGVLVSGAARGGGMGDGVFGLVVVLLVALLFR